jgi:pyruvate,orthophosphate dikinase
MIAAEGIPDGERRRLVARGARRAADGKVCICGASALQIDYAKKTVSVADQSFKEGDYLSIDGTAAPSTPANRDCAERDHHRHVARR